MDLPTALQEIEQLKKQIVELNTQLEYVRGLLHTADYMLGLRILNQPIPFVDTREAEMED